MVSKKKTTKKKTKRRVAGKAPAKKRLPVWVILLSGILAGLVIAVTAYVNGWVPKIDSVQKIEVTTNPDKPEIEDKSQELQIKPKKDYVFYETLQDMEVVIDDTELVETVNDDPVNYILQLGSFKNLSDAEELKAKVAFIGITTNIQSADVNDTRWYRVRTNTFESSRKAGIVLKDLKKNGFKAIILKEKQTS